MYQLKQGFDGIFRMADEVWIPNNPLNSDWRMYQAWLKEGNKPVESDLIKVTNE